MDIEQLPGIETRIQVMRRIRVMVDADKAELYGVTTKRLNEQVKRNRARFPADFMFQLSDAEKAEVVAHCDHLRKLKFSKSLPRAFTEHGAIQAANVLASPQAIEMGIHRRACLRAHARTGHHARRPGPAPCGAGTQGRDTGAAPRQAAARYPRPVAASVRCAARTDGATGAGQASDRERPLCVTCCNTACRCSAV